MMKAHFGALMALSWAPSRHLLFDFVASHGRGETARADARRRPRYVTYACRVSLSGRITADNTDFCIFAHAAPRRLLCDTLQLGLARVPACVRMDALKGAGAVSAVLACCRLCDLPEPYLICTLCNYLSTPSSSHHLLETAVLLSYI